MSIIDLVTMGTTPELIHNAAVIKRNFYREAPPLSSIIGYGAAYRDTVSQKMHPKATAIHVLSPELQSS